MCYECISILAELYRFYTEFMEMTKEASYMQSILEDSSLWTSKSLSQSHDVEQEKKLLKNAKVKTKNKEKSESKEKRIPVEGSEESEHVILVIESNEENVVDDEFGADADEPMNYHSEPEPEPEPEVMIIGTKNGVSAPKITVPKTAEPIQNKCLNALGKAFTFIYLIKYLVFRKN
jgi:hypothetical protein